MQVRAGSLPARNQAAVRLVDLVVAAEVGQVDAAVHDVLPVAARRAQHALEVAHDGVGLLGEACRARSAPVSGTIGIWPVTKTKPPATVACEKGAMGFGAEAAEQVNDIHGVAASSVPQGEEGVGWW